VISVGFLLTRHPPDRVSPIMPEVMQLLRARGAAVEAIHPEEGLVDLGLLDVAHDLYVLKSGSDTALSLAGALHSAGAAILNPYPVSAACRDKIILTQVLRGARVPLPETYVAAHPSELHRVVSAGPIVVKPYRGSQGRGVRVIRDPAELQDVESGDGPLFAQRYHQPKGRDRKLYCIGDQVFGVKRVWPVRTYEQKLGEAFAVSGELRDIALRCGAAFGIRLFGLDVVETDDGPYVVDFSSFPGFKGVPGAARLLADHIWEVAHRGFDTAPEHHAPGPSVGPVVGPQPTVAAR
jgi:ribosomal protein S6--L-glutamate ligase